MANLRLLLFTEALLLTCASNKGVRGFCDEMREVVNNFFLILPKSLREWEAQLPLPACMLPFPKASCLTAAMCALDAPRCPVCRTLT